MDPQDTNPTRSSDTQNNTPDTSVPAAANDAANPGIPPSAASDPYGAPGSGTAPDTSDSGLSDATGPVQGVEVDLSNPAGPNADEPGDTGNSAPADGGIVSAPTDVAFNNDPTQPSITSEGVPPAPVDQSGNSGTSDNASMAANFGAAPSAPATTPPADTVTTGESPLGSPPAPSDPAPVTPATAPLPVHPADKKTIFVLGGVAVLLIALILFLFFR